MGIEDPMTGPDSLLAEALSSERELVRVDMSPSFVNDPEHWRDRAKEKRPLPERAG